MKAAPLAIPALLVLAVGAGAEFFAVRGKLAAERDAVNAAWSAAEMALQDRAALVAELAELVRGYAPRETALFTKTGEAGLALLNGRTREEKIAANERLSGALSRLRVLSENYPGLESNRNFLRLEREIAAAENNIAVERRKYNESVQEFNTEVRSFPTSVVAGFGHFSAKVPFKATTAGAETAPKVQF